MISFYTLSDLILLDLKQTVEVKYLNHANLSRQDNKQKSSNPIEIVVFLNTASIQFNDRNRKK